MVDTQANPTEQEQYWWGAEVRDVSIVVDKPSCLAEGNLIYDAFRDYGESAAPVQFESGFELKHARPPYTVHSWRYVRQHASREDPDFSPPPLSPLPQRVQPSKPSLDQAAKDQASDRRIDAIEEIMHRQQVHIDRLEESTTRTRSDLLAAISARTQSISLKELIGRLRNKVAIASRKISKRPVKTEEGGSTDTDEAVDGLIRRSMVIEVDCSSTLFAEFARKLYHQFAIADVSDANRISFYPSYTSTQEHSSNTPMYAIYMPSIVQVSAAIDIYGNKDIYNLILKTHLKKDRVDKPGGRDEAKAEVRTYIDCMRLSGTYVCDKKDDSSRSDIFPGGSHYNETAETSPVPIGPGPVIPPGITTPSIARDSRECDYTRGTHAFTHPLYTAITVRATSPIDPSKPERLRGFYFQWKPLPQVPHEFTNNVKDGTITHGRLVLNCPYLCIFGEDKCRDILSIWKDSQLLRKVLVAFRE